MGRDGTTSRWGPTVRRFGTNGAAAATSLPAEVRALVRVYVPVLGFSPTVRTSGPVDTAVPATVAEQLLPVLREAVSNVARHALAGSADVDVSVSETEVRLVVSDDGTGLAEDRSESGLRNARRRRGRPAARSSGRRTPRAARP